MANELKHTSVGSAMTQSEFEGVGLHVFDSQATGDIVYASSGTQLSRLAKGEENTFLQMSGTIPEWVVSPTIGDGDQEDIQINYDGNAVDFHMGIDDSADDFIIGTGTTMGSNPAITVDGGGTLATTFYGNVLIAGGTPKLTIGDADQEDTTIVFDGNAVDFHVALDDTADDLVIGTGSTVGSNTAITVDGSTRNVTIATDLTISGDDLYMATNTSGHVLVADGTNYNPVAVSGDVTMASDGAVTIGSGVVEHGMLADDIVSGQAEITSGLVSADEMMYSDGGVIKRIGVDVLATKLLGLASAGTVAQASDHMLFLDNGATGDVIVESIDDFLSAIAGSGISVSSSQLTASSSGVSVGKAIAFSIVF